MFSSPLSRARLYLHITFFFVSTFVWLPDLVSSKVHILVWVQRNGAFCQISGVPHEGRVFKNLHNLSLLGEDGTLC
ncbi:hypothetical protein ACU8KH_03479 [Lachancea thermotolerans]